LIYRDVITWIRIGEEAMYELSLNSFITADKKAFSSTSRYMITSRIMRIISRSIYLMGENLPINLKYKKASCDSASTQKFMLKCPENRK
jgi:hypothetical protein